MGEQFTLADGLVMPSIDRMAELGLVHVLGRSISGRRRMVHARLRQRPSFKATYYPGSRVAEFLQFRPLYMEGRGSD